MSLLNPKALFERIARDVPENLHGHLLLTGSLAAAYHFEAQLERHAVNTKDADVVIHPAGDQPATRATALGLLERGWRRTDECFARPSPEPHDALRAIRLYPPQGHDYFLELLNLPEGEQAEPKRWYPVELGDGWYGLPSFRFMGLTAVGALTSHVGLMYASPAMMALSNLLAHATVGGGERMKSGPFEGLLRSAKDLGRVLALAWLAGREGTEEWLAAWRDGLVTCFPTQHASLTKTAGLGLRALVSDADALEEARLTTEASLLSGKGVSAEALRVTAERLFLDVIEPLAESNPP